MASSHTNLLYHIVFSTKLRQKLITSALGDELYSYIGGIIRNERGTLLEIGGTEDHVHILAKFRPDVSVSGMLRLIKANSSKWANDHQELRDFAWQTGYGAFTVSESQVPAIREYIQNQAERHRTLSFQEEYLALLRKNGIQYDERYIWD